MKRGGEREERRTEFYCEVERRGREQRTKGGEARLSVY